jgi:hypothetical protein
MEDYAMPKRMLKGRPKMRWLDDVESDLKKMKVKGWKEMMRNREQWRLVEEETKAHPGCSAEWKEGRKEGTPMYLYFITE